MSSIHLFNNGGIAMYKTVINGYTYIFATKEGAERALKDWGELYE